MYDYCVRMKKLRESCEYTQSDVAQLLNIRQEQYSKYETGKRDLPIKHLVSLSKIYRVSTDYILGVSKSKKICK